MVTVMGTENAILAAVLADGHTVIRPAAREPEVDDLIALLQKMGAEVERTAPDTIEIEGQRRLRGAEHRVVPDRIEAGTFVIAAAVTGGDMTLENAPCEHLGAFLDVVSDIGVPDRLRPRHDRGPLRRRARASCSSRRDIETAPYPGLATDLQSPTSVLLTPGQRHQPAARDDLRGPARVAGRAAPPGRAASSCTTSSTHRSTDHRR